MNSRRMLQNTEKNSLMSVRIMKQISGKKLLEEFKSYVEEEQQRRLIESYIKNFSLMDLERQFDIQIKEELNET